MGAGRQSSARCYRLQRCQSARRSGQRACRVRCAGIIGCMARRFCLDAAGKRTGFVQPLFRRRAVWRMMKSYDAVVIGAGPAGATAAFLLARAGWSVVVVEKTAFPRRKVCGAFISATSLPLLHELGVAATFSTRAGPQIRQVGLYAGETMLAADMPGTGNGSGLHGRALGREHLD